MPHCHYDTPTLSPRVKGCRNQQNEYRYRNSTAAAAHQVCGITAAYSMDPSSMEAEEVQSRSASVSISTGITCLWLRRLLRFQAYLCLRVRGHSPQLPSTFQPPRLLLRFAQQNRNAQMWRPRRLMLRPSQQSSWSAASQSARTSRALRNGAKYRTITPLAACMECGGESLQPLLSQPLFITPSKTRLKPLLSPPMLSRPYGMPPGVVNNLKPQAINHPLYHRGYGVYHTPKVYHPGDKFQNPNNYHRGVVYPVVDAELFDYCR